MSEEGKRFCYDNHKEIQRAQKRLLNDTCEKCTLGAIMEVNFPSLRASIPSEIPDVVIQEMITAMFFDSIPTTLAGGCLGGMVEGVRLTFEQRREPTRRDKIRRQFEGKLSREDLEKLLKDLFGNDI